jgi:hypothetical protein
MRAFPKTSSLQRCIRTQRHHCARTAGAWPTCHNRRRLQEISYEELERLAALRSAYPNIIPADDANSAIAPPASGKAGSSGKSGSSGGAGGSKGGRNSSRTGSGRGGAGGSSGGGGSKGSSSGGGGGDSGSAAATMARGGYYARRLAEAGVTVAAVNTQLWASKRRSLLDDVEALAEEQVRDCMLLPRAAENARDCWKRGRSVLRALSGERRSECNPMLRASVVAKFALSPVLHIVPSTAHRRKLR